MADRFVANPRAPGTTDTGLRDPGITVTQRLIADVSDEIHLYSPRATPFMALTSALRGKRAATQYRFDWLEKDEFPSTFDAVTDGGTTFTVGSGQGVRLRKDDLLLTTVGRELILVSVTPSTDAVTVVRAINGISTTVATDGTEQLVLLGNAVEDGTTIGAFVSVREVDNYNYTQIFRTPFGFTGRQANTSYYGGKDTDTERKYWGIEHGRKIENHYLFGSRFTRTGTGGKLQTGMGGLEQFVKSNIWELGGKKPTARAFDEYLEYAMKVGQGGNEHGSSTKYLFCSSRWRTEFDWFAKDRIQTKTLEKVAGLAIGEYQSSHGRIMLVTTPVLDRNHPDWAFLVDLNEVTPVYHQGRDNKLLTGREANDSDSTVEEYFADVSLEVNLEAAHGIIRGLPL